MQTPKSAGIYCRLSFAPDGSPEKVERQEADCRALAKRLGWKVRQVYPDNSRSAWQRDRKRPAWEQMLKDIEAGLLDGILVYHGDRLIRQPWDLELLLKLADDRHIPLASPSGTKDLRSEEDRYVLRIEVAGACKASADTSRRVRRGIEARASKGGSGAGSNRPFGYGVPTGEVGRTGKPLYDLTRQNRSEAAIGREAVGRFLAGQSQGGVIAWMNTKCTTTKGNPWKANAFRAWLSSPRIAGLVEHDGQLYPAQWKGLISRGEWEDARALLQKQSDTYGYSGRERVHLLTGKAAECGGCRGPLYTKPSGQSRLYYCKNPQCPSPVSRNVRLLDEYVIGHVLRMLNDKRLLKRLAGQSRDPGLGKEIAALERRKAKDKATIESLADHPDVDIALLVKGLASYDRKMADLRGRLAATSQQRLLTRLAGFTREQWDAEPIDVRAEAVRSLFKVTVLPTTRRGPGFDTDAVRLEPMWKLHD